MKIILDDYLEIFHKDLTKKLIVGQCLWYDDRVIVRFEKKVKGFLNGDGKTYKELTIPTSNLITFTYGVNKFGTYKEWKKQKWVKKVRKNLIKHHYGSKESKDWMLERYKREFCILQGVLDNGIDVV